MQFKFKPEQSDRDRLFDQVVAAMETGNTARARELVAEHRETFPEEIKFIQTQVVRDYGVRL